MKIALIGYDTEGKASYEYYAAAGHDVTICDQNPAVEVPAGVATQLGDNYLQDLARFDVIVRTAGLHPDKILNANPTVADKITSCTNEFMEVSPCRNMIGVTGTKGKGTTSSLIAAMLQAAGKRVHIGGNIGVPALSLLKDDIGPEDWIVLELSSFQLIDIKHSPRLAACLMVVPEHLDWHASLEEYVSAKQNLFRRQTADDVAVYYADNERSTEIASAGLATKIPYFRLPGAVIRDNNIVMNEQVICGASEVRLRGAHNLQNICAALTVVWQITQDVEALRQTLTTFAGLEHRLELVRTVNSVSYYDDSFGTTPETATVAIEAFAEPKVVILGGSDKGASYDALAQTVASTSIRKALVIGDQAARMQAALEAAGFTNYEPGGDSMPEIVAKAALVAEPGDVVLLSPGCASFGMFKNYKDRGNQFKTAVQSLAAAGE
jgi:UDP-N-acetylmuramoylalanine--D-glutamate ligase